MKSYRIPTISLLAVTLGLLAAPLQAKEKKAPPAKSANQYAAFDTHPNEKLTIAADPCTEPKDCDFFRLPYVQHAFIPIRVIFTNDGDTALSLDDVRIQFISADNEILPAATEDEINRRLFTMKAATGTRIPMPSPIPAITIHHPSVDKKITEDDDDFGFSGTVVNAHSTLAGYLFYDISTVDNPPLKNASLYIKDIHTLDDKKHFFSYTIPFNKWLAAQPTAKPDQ